MPPRIASHCCARNCPSLPISPRSASGPDAFSDADPSAFPSAFPSALASPAPTAPHAPFLRTLPAQPPSSSRDSGSVRAPPSGADRVLDLIRRAADDAGPRMPANVAQVRARTGVAHERGVGSHGDATRLVVCTAGCAGDLTCLAHCACPTVGFSHSLSHMSLAPCALRCWRLPSPAWPRPGWVRPWGRVPRRGCTTRTSGGSSSPNCR